MQGENEDFLKDQEYQSFLDNLFPVLIEVANYSELITLPEFWKYFATIKDKNLQDKIIEKICLFYECKECHSRLRRSANCSWICYNCNLSSPDFNDEFNKFARFDCLKCFKLYKIESFNMGQCQHLCGYCIAKELKKGRSACRICTKDYVNINAGEICVQCNESKFFGELNELRCGCIYCNNCFLHIKKAKRCFKCPGINVLTSELYDFSKKSSEICFVCGQDKIISREENGQIKEEFEKKECCNLDICIGCKKKSGSKFCIGCEQTAK